MTLTLALLLVAPLLDTLSRGYHFALAAVLRLRRPLRLLGRGLRPLAVLLVLGMGGGLAYGMAGLVYAIEPDLLWLAAYVLYFWGFVAVRLAMAIGRQTELCPERLLIEALSLLWLVAVFKGLLRGMKRAWQAFPPSERWLTLKR